jgi:hypothetical protein
MPPCFKNGAGGIRTYKHIYGPSLRVIHDRGCQPVQKVLTEGHDKHAAPETIPAR